MRSRIHPSRGALLCIVLWAVSTQVHAETPSTSPDQARAAQREGDRLHDAGDLRGALEQYGTAHAVLDEPTSGLRLANVQAALGLLVEARQTAADTSSLPARRGEPAEFAPARKAAERLAAEIEPRLPVFAVSVSPPTSYTLRIDDALMPASMHGLRFRTSPGDHVVEVEAAGFRPAKQTITLSEGAYQLFVISLQRASEPATPSSDSLQATAPPAQSTRSPAPMSAPLSEPEDPAVRAQRTRGYIALGVGGAVVAASLITGLVSFVQTSNAKASCAGDVCPDRLRSKLEAADTLANITNIALPIGLLGAAFGMYELLTLSEPSSLQVQVESRGAYASLRGHL